MMTKNPLKKPAIDDLPAFWSPLSDEDITVLRKRNSRRRFDLSMIHSVAARCSYSFPQVLICRPHRRGGAPFPTMFWLTCPFLDRKCGELESLQKIRELEELFRARQAEVSLWHEKYALLRKSISLKDIDMPTGVGGINWHDAPYAVKCLHLQVATWLGWRYHPAEDWLKEQLEVTECACGICGKRDDGQ
ncbi:MAG: DUF501 domain-containing protein [Synergistaceae bacterium]|nr:DUF501 domain-containing protein [Synergistaceae bacterium]